MNTEAAKYLAVGALLFVAGFWASLLVSVVLRKNVAEGGTPAVVGGSASPSPKVSMITPSQALPATLLEATGSVERSPWDSFDTEPAATGSALFQGDEIITHALSGSVIQIQKLGLISLSENSDLQLSSMVGERVVLRQVSGTVDYVLKSSLPLNIDVGRTLLSVASGEVSIKYKDHIASISLKKGRAKLGYYVNSTDTTKVWALTSGDTARVNDDFERVVTTGSLVQ